MNMHMFWAAMFIWSTFYRGPSPRALGATHAKQHGLHYQWCFLNDMSTWCYDQSKHVLVSNSHIVHWIVKTLTSTSSVDLAEFHDVGWLYFAKLQNIQVSLKKQKEIKKSLNVRQPPNWPFWVFSTSGSKKLCFDELGF